MPLNVKTQINVLRNGIHGNNVDDLLLSGLRGILREIDFFLLVAPYNVK